MRGSNSVIEYKIWSCNVLITDWFWRDINQPPLQLSWSTFFQCANTIANKDFKWILVGTQAVHECNLDCLRQQNCISDICPISAGCVIWHTLPLETHIEEKRPLEWLWVWFLQRFDGVRKKQLDSWKDLPGVTTFYIPFVHCHLKDCTEVLLEETDCHTHCTPSGNYREMPTFMVRLFSMLNCNTVARCKHCSHLNQHSSQSRNTERTSRRNPGGPNNEWWSCFVGRQVCVCTLLSFQNAKIVVKTVTQFFFGFYSPVGTVKAWAMTAGQQWFWHPWQIYPSSSISPARCLCQIGEDLWKLFQF